MSSSPQVGNYIQTLWNEIKPEEEDAEVSKHLKFPSSALAISGDLNGRVFQFPLLSVSLPPQWRSRSSNNTCWSSSLVASEVTFRYLVIHVLPSQFCAHSLVGPGGGLPRSSLRPGCRHPLPDGHHTQHLDRIRWLPTLQITLPGLINVRNCVNAFHSR